MSTLKLDDIALFVEIARQMSFIKASEQLNIPPSTLSRRLHQLEQSLNVQLLKRSTRALHLTPSGQFYFEQCLPILDHLSAVHDQLQHQTQAISGLIRLSCAVDMGLCYIAPLMDDFLKLYPDIQFEIDLSSHNVDLDKDHFDVAIRMGALADSLWIAKYLGSISFQLYAAPDYIHIHGMPAHPDELAQRHCLYLNTKSMHYQPIWQLYQDELSVDVALLPSSFRTNNLSLIQKISEAGHGIAAMPTKQAEASVHAGLLLPVLPQWRTASVAAHALLPQRTMPLRVRCWIDYIAQHIALN